VSSLSTEGYYFGVTFGENDRGEVSVTQLMPGGPAWKLGEVHPGDILQILQWEGQEAIDLWGFSLNEVNDILAETNHATIAMTLRKADGTYKTVSLRKEKVEAEETQVKSFLLDGTRKVGYISLPDFYTNWDDQEGSQCARDVAREVMKLKKENIEGLILDLRFNGGGSMDEAVAMAGIFIDAGPVGVVKGRTGEMRTVKDVNRGTVYDGPLVLMVNGLSASASEFLAAALQDYRRAVVVGGRTYGKATAQTLSPVDPKIAPTAMADFSKAPAQSYSSITLEKMYRITGKTAQQSGVVPDIILHDALEALPIREADLPRAFPSDSIQKKMYYQPLPALPLKTLQDLSASRVKGLPQFTALQAYGQQIAALEHRHDKVSLVWADFKKQYDVELAMVAGVEKNSNATANAFKASRLHAVEQRMQMDAYTDEFNRSWIKNLQDDIFVNEAFLIICDYIPNVIKK
jgi:carboxyl-terminal processing protease